MNNSCSKCNKGQYVSSLNGIKVAIMIALAFFAIFTAFIGLLPAIGVGAVLNGMMPTYVTKCNVCGLRR